MQLDRGKQCLAERDMLATCLRKKKRESSEKWFRARSNRRSSPDIDGIFNPRTAFLRTYGICI